jgi:hypothetical protein
MYLWHYIPGAIQHLLCINYAGLSGCYAAARLSHPDRYCRKQTKEGTAMSLKDKAEIPSGQKIKT